MDCNCFQKKYLLYLDRVLSAEETEAIEKHIASCTSCRAYAGVYKNIIQSCKSLPAVEMPEDIKEKILKIPQTEEVLEPVPSPGYNFRFALTASLAALLILFLFTTIKKKNIASPVMRDAYSPRIVHNVTFKLKEDRKTKIFVGKPQLHRESKDVETLSLKIARLKVGKQHPVFKINPRIVYIKNRINSLNEEEIFGRYEL